MSEIKFPNRVPTYAIFRNNLSKVEDQFRQLVHSPECDDIYSCPRLCMCSESIYRRKYPLNIETSLLWSLAEEIESIQVIIKDSTEVINNKPMDIVDIVIPKRIEDNYKEIHCAIDKVHLAVGVFGNHSKTKLYYTIKGICSMVVKVSRLIFDQDRMFPKTNYDRYQLRVKILTDEIKELKSHLKYIKKKCEKNGEICLD